MRIKPAALGLVLLAAGAFGASAQTSLTASLPGMMGGVGVTPHGTGFNGTMGDPDYYIAGTELPASEGHYPGPYGTMGPPSRQPSISPYPAALPAAGTPAPMQYQFGRQPAR